MKEIRILFTGTGRRVELLQAFRNAALCLKQNLKIYSADMSETAPAAVYCDYVRKICAMKDADYIQQLMDICRRDRIDLVIPTIDTDLLILSQNAERFEAIGTRVLISRPDKIAICRDKNYTSDFFVSCGLEAPMPVNDYLKYQGDYPCFIKPKDGSSSINAFKVNDKNELSMYAGQIGDYIIQPFIEGREYTIDIFCDFNGKPIYITPRERIAVRSGEVLKTKIELDETIIEEAKSLISHFCPCGPMTVQLIRQKDTGRDYYIEINPRYGGGAPLSMKAGADSASVLLKLLMGEEPGYQPDAVRNGAVYSRFDQSIRITSESRRNDGSLENIKGVIFDLDDTLYSEKQYVKSGYRAVAGYLGSETAEEELWNYFLNGKNAIDELLKKYGQTDKKAECLEIYRSHMPELNLYEEAVVLLNNLKEAGFKLGIITDGRVNGQKNKIESLGLRDLVDDIIITDELGGEQFRKPNDIAFRIMQCRWRLPYEELVYIGDNMIKDFQAPRQLGMKSIYFNNEDGLYYSPECDGGSCDAKVTELKQIWDMICW
ncbi:MAG: HAD-IA family hydrolase [Lachnospiraceae bacterium]|nr:HAD-IA family hydrolase [Lachnospiraceae bacterium]